MPFQIQCVQCQTPFTVYENQAGTIAPCPTCGAQNTVPGTQIQYTETAPAGGGIMSGILGKLGGIVGFILLLVIVNVIMYVGDCGYVVY